MRLGQVKGTRRPQRYPQRSRRLQSNALQGGRELVDLRIAAELLGLP